MTRRRETDSAPRLERRSRLHVMVSKACSNRCVFCLEDSKLRRSASFGDSYRILERFQDRSAVLFTCGEPTLNPELISFVEHARNLGYHEIELVTNGRKLGDPDYCRRLLDGGLTGLTISLHSHRPEIHDLITGRRAFLQTLAGLTNVASARDARRTDLRINTVICKLNLSDIVPAVCFFAALRPDVINLNFVEPTGKAAARFADLVPRMKEVSPHLARLRKPDEIREIVVTGMPPCVLPPRWVRSGNREIIHLWNGERFVELKANRGQIFGPPCDACSSRASCDGIWRAYADRYGWEEMSAMPRENQSR